MAGNEADDKSLEIPEEITGHEGPPMSDELKMAYEERTVALTHEQKERVSDYRGNTVRDSSSYLYLKDVRLSLDGEDGRSLTGLALPADNVPAEFGLDSNIQQYQDRLDGERILLTSLAESRIKDPAELKKFKQDMDLLEERPDKLEEMYRKQFEKQGYSPEEAGELAKRQSLDEVSETFKQVGRVLGAEGDKPLKQEDRIMVAEQILYHAADPTTVDQGQHPTCNVSTVESRLYARSPSTVATMLADVALTGQYQTHGDPKLNIKLDDNSLTPDSEAEKNHYPTGDDRSFASQLFQVTSMNIAWELYNRRQDPPTDLHYVQLHDKAVMVEGSKDPLKEPSERQPNDIDTVEMVDTSNQITGQEEKQFVLQQLPVRDDEKVSRVETQGALSERLYKMKQDGELPAIVFLADDGGEPLGADGGTGGWHVVSVTDYHPGDPPTVELDNQWGETKDHLGGRAVALDTLFKLMKKDEAT